MFVRQANLANFIKDSCGKFYSLSRQNGSFIFLQNEALRSETINYLNVTTSYNYYDVLFSYKD